MDVTPSCSILLNGGIDYDLPTDLAELVDNAIAALEPSSAQGHGSHRTNRISIDMLPPSHDNGGEGPILRLSDSGRGMGLHELRAWATLGEIAAADHAAKDASVGKTLDLTHTHTHTHHLEQ